MAGKKDSLLQSAEKNLQKGRLEAALKDLLAALEDGGFDLNLLNRVGDLYVRLNRVEEAIPCFVRIAEHWVKDQRWPQATAIYKRINRLDPARLDVYEKLGELYAKQGLAADSRTHYQVLADHYLRQDNVAGAIGICQKMAAIDPGAVEVHVRLADLLVQSKRVPEAMKEYAAVAALMKASGAAGQAAQVYAKALKIAPDNGEILRALVPLLVEQGAGEEARAAIRRALETTPRSVSLFLLAADTAVTLGDLAEARGFIAKAQAVEPENEDVVSAAVKIHLRSRRPELAFAAAQPLADAWLRRGEAKKAAGLLVPIVRGIPEHEEGLRKVAEVLSAAGEEKDALPFRSALADVLRNTGRLAEAADILRVLSRSYPDVPEFRARLGQIEPLLPAAGPVRATVGEPAEGPLSVAIPRIQHPAVEPAPAPAPPVGAGDEFEFVLEEAPAVEEAAPASPAQAGEGFSSAAPPSFEFEIPDLDRSGRPGEASAAPVDPASVPAPPSAAAEAVVEEIEELGALDQVHPSEELYTGGAEALEQPPTMAFEPPATIAFPRVATPSTGTRAPWPSEKAGRTGPIGGPAAFDGPEVDEAIVEAEIFRKYGLVDKAVEQLRAAIKRYPASIRIREKLFEVYLEQGLRVEARREAESLHSAYLADGRTERARGLESLLGESLGPSPAAPAAGAIPAPRGVDLSTLTPAPALRGGQKLRPLTADDIEIPMPLGLPAPARTRKGARPVPEIELPAELQALESSVRAHARTAARAPEFPSTPIDQIEAMVPTIPAAPTVPTVPTVPAVSAPPAPLSAQVASFPGDDLARESFEAGFALPAPAPPEPVSDFISFQSLGAELPDEALLDEIEEVRPGGTIEEAAAEAMAGLDAAAAAGEADGARAGGASAALPQPTLAVRALGAGPSPDDLSEIDFCLDQGMVVDAAERLQALDARFPGDPAVQQRRVRLEGTRVVAEDARPALDEIFAEDLDSVLDAELGRALTVEMAKGAAASDAAARPPDATRARTPVSLDESGLFSDEQEFFDFAEELQTELKETAAASPSAPDVDGPSGAGSLEEIFREFKKGVEQQLSPEDFETHYNLGIAYKEMGLTDEAIGEFQVASKDPAHSVECCSMLGLCFLEKGLPQLAIKWYRKGLEAPNLRDEDRMGLQYDLAGVYLDVGDRDSAYRSYVDIYGIDANYRDVGEKLKAFAN